MSSVRTIETALSKGLLTQAMDPVLRMSGHVHDDEHLVSVVLTPDKDGNYKISYSVKKEVEVINHN